MGMLLLMLLTGCFAGGEVPGVRTQEILIAEKYDANFVNDLINKRHVEISDLSKLSHHANYNVRSIIASHPLTPVAILTNLSVDDNWLVRLEAVCNANIDPKAKEVALSKEKDERFLDNFKFRQRKE